LVNASRRFGTTDPLDSEDDSLLDLMECNLRTTFRLTQAVAKRMIKQGGEQEEGPLGTVVNLSSTAALTSHPDLLGFSVAAAAMNQLTRSFALALAPHRIRVNAVALGSVLSASLQTELKENKEWRAQIEEATPLGRVGSPAELTDVVQFLVSDASAFMTGEILTVDGGRTLLDAVDVPAH
jgi:7-alpha-hydroxysteroid dehydrogenase